MTANRAKLTFGIIENNVLIYQILARIMKQVYLSKNNRDCL